MPMCHPVPWMLKQWAIAAGNVPNGNFNGPETHAQILDNEKLKKKKKKKIYLVQPHTHFDLILAHKQLLQTTEAVILKMFPVL